MYPEKGENEKLQVLEYYFRVARGLLHITKKGREVE